MATAQTRATGHRYAAMTRQQLLGFEAVVINSKRLIKQGMRLLITCFQGQKRRSMLPKHVAVFAAIWRQLTITLKPEVPLLNRHFLWKGHPLKIYSLISSSPNLLLFGFGVVIVLQAVGTKMCDIKVSTMKGVIVGDPQ